MTNDAPVNCKDGHTGPLCTVCTFVEDEKYMRQGTFGCAKCPKKLANYFWVIGLLLLFIIYIGIMIFINSWKKKESNLSILTKIMSNYFQILSTSLAFSFQWPEFMGKIFEPINFIGKGSTEMAVSFDCMLDKTWIEMFGNSDFIYKSFLSIIFVIFLFLLYWLISLIIKLVLWKFINIKWLIIIAFITILFTQYASISSIVLNMFNCISIEEKSFLVRDM